MKFGAIDIGSNAIRLQITNTIEFEDLLTFKKLEYIRFPLRLGQDVFSMGRIGEEKKDKFIKLMMAYKNLIDLYAVDAYYGCATSAMREAENGEMIVRCVRDELGLDIDIISGEYEAEMINGVIHHYLEKDKAYIHIDVGGGSTELNFYSNQEKIFTKSFPIGSVRRLGKYDSPEVWDEIKNWVVKNIRKEYGRVSSIGTGGNINKIFELGAKTKKRWISLKKIQEVQDYIKNMSLEERMFKLQLNPDRADVIIPASEIYVHVIKAAKSKSIYVPDVGLKDGINYMLFKQHFPHERKVMFRN
ncbi:MAG TPA: phosphatase [Cyclobacteriaceae bacterium]